MVWSLTECGKKLGNGNKTPHNLMEYLYEGSGNAWAGQSKAKEPPKFFSKVPKDFESDENLGNAPPIGSEFCWKIDFNLLGRSW